MDCQPDSVDLFVVAGEPSGDLQAAQWLSSLIQLRPDLKIGAVAGPRMRALPLRTFFPMENLQVMGFIDVLFALPHLFRQFFAIRNQILRSNPQVVVCVDYPGFNLRLERSLRKKGYKGKLIHFVCPTVWAWGKKRIPLMAQTLDQLLTLLPFEKACFAHTSLPVEYVGHPLVKAVNAFIPSSTFRKRHGFSETAPILSLFPGSRKTEIERNFPLQWDTAKKLLKMHPDWQLAVSIAHEQFSPLLRQLAADAEVHFIPPQEHYDLMQQTHLALATSGTVTLELALHGIMSVVHFAIRPLDCWIAQKVFKINLPYYSLPNLILNEKVYPELFGPHLSASSLYAAALELADSPEARKLCLEGCLRLRKALGTKDSSQETALHILAQFNNLQSL